MPADNPLTMDASAIPGGTVFAVNTETRTIRGRAVPYGVVGTKNGMKFQFSQGTIRAREDMKVKLWALHDKTMASGVVTEWTDTPEGLDVAFRVGKGPKGDEALQQADDGVWDGLSIGPSEGARYTLRDGVYHAVDIPIHEISLTPAPVFGGAQVRSVAFDVDQEHDMTDTTTEPVTPAAAALPETFSADVQDAISKGFGAVLGGLERPQEITHGTAEVIEPSPYRFDGTAGAQSFSEDLRAFNTDSEARQRLTTFMEDAHAATFAVTTGNVTNLNPTQNRPDLFVPNLTFTRPLWDMVTNGVITDKTPFTIPKFSSAAGLVNPHTEGVEPTPGSFSATVQTITPGAVSGKVEINREVWDQGGNPKADAIIWGEMQNGYYEAIEAKIAATLAAVGTAEVNLASAVDSALVNAVTNLLVDLQFTRGGNRFSGLALDGLLFKALVNAADGQGRKLLPPIGPTNAQGQVSAAFDRVQLGSLAGRAAWALGATNASKSYLFVPGMVYAWASAPKRFDFEYRVAAVDLAIWGYTASAVLRDSDVKPIDYTTADV